MGAGNPKGEGDFDEVSLITYRRKDVLRKRGPQHSANNAGHPLELTGMPSLNTTLGIQKVFTDCMNVGPHGYLAVVGNVWCPLPGLGLEKKMAKHYFWLYPKGCFQNKWMHELMG